MKTLSRLLGRAPRGPTPIPVSAMTSRFQALPPSPGPVYGPMYDPKLSGALSPHGESQLMERRRRQGTLPASTVSRIRGREQAMTSDHYVDPKRRERLGIGGAHALPKAPTEVIGRSADASQGGLPFSSDQIEMGKMFVNNAGAFTSAVVGGVGGYMSAEEGEGLRTAFNNAAFGAVTGGAFTAARVEGVHRVVEAVAGFADRSVRRSATMTGAGLRGAGRSVKSGNNRAFKHGNSGK